MDEVWRPIEGWKGYEVSNLGRIRSCKWPSTKRKWLPNPERGYRILRQDTRNKYAYVLLSDAIVGSKKVNVNVLVLEAFVGPRPEGMQAAHDDGDPLNNREYNLRWATPTDNNADKKKHGTHQYGELIGSSKLTWDQVNEIRMRKQSGERTRCLAEEYGVHKNTITNITSGRNWNGA